jgi:hypothetical protein
VNEEFEISLDDTPERTAKALERIADALERYLNLIAPTPKRTEPPAPYQDGQSGMWRIDGVEGMFYNSVQAVNAWREKHKNEVQPVSA